MSSRVKRVGTAPVGSPKAPHPRRQQQEQQQLSRSCKLPMLPKQSDSEPSTADKLSRYQKLLPGFPFAAKTAVTTTARLSTTKKISNDETAANLREFFEIIMTGNPKQAAVGCDPVSFISGSATTSHRQRAEIYAINKILRENELEKFNRFMENIEKPQFHQDPSLSDDSDSENSCIDYGAVRKSATGKSSKSRSLTSATMLAAAIRSQPVEHKRSYKAKKKLASGVFGAV